MNTSKLIVPPKQPIGPPKQVGQQGAVLIVSLILLLVMTIIGVTNMRSSTLQMKMATNSHNRTQAFSAAEYALKEVEKDIQTSFISKYDPDQYVQSCSSGCFNTDCDGGLCFNGTLTWSSRPECQVAYESDSTKLAYGNYWTKETIWNSKAQKFSVPHPKVSAKYIIEFMCYTHKNPSPSIAAYCDVSSPLDCLPVYRITVLAEGEGNSKVMLQATTKIND